jgi:uncharacterized RDD family membrane protein YckC
VSDAVTGNAVLVELRPARLASRAVALAIDVAVMLLAFGALLVVLALSGLVEGVDTALAAAVGLVVTLSVFVGYPVVFETLTRGRSLGKLAVGLRVVREDGGPIRFRHALTRGLVGYVVDFGLLSGFTGAIGLISSLASARGRRVGDVLAGTLVVWARVPATAAAAPIEMPAPLAGWAATLSLSGLPDPLALQVRDFLRRAPRLAPKARTAMAGSLSAEVAGLTAEPPPGTPPEAHLAAVVAERRRREDERLAAQNPAAQNPAAQDPAVQHPAEPDPARWRAGAPTPPPADRPDGFALPR